MRTTADVFCRWFSSWLLRCSSGKNGGRSTMQRGTPLVQERHFPHLQHVLRKFAGDRETGSFQTLRAVLTAADFEFTLTDSFRYSTFKHSASFNVCTLPWHDTVGLQGVWVAEPEAGPRLKTSFGIKYMWYIYFIFYGLCCTQIRFIELNISKYKETVVKWTSLRIFVKKYGPDSCPVVYISIKATL